MYTSVYGGNFIKSSKKQKFDDEWGNTEKNKSKDKKKNKQHQKQRDNKRNWEQPE